MAVEKQWRKITEIGFASPIDFQSKVPLTVASAEDAKKIIQHSVEFCDVLKVGAARMKLAIRFGPFRYKLENANFDDMLHFMAENITDITAIEFFEPPKTELMQLFFKQNKIKRVSVERCSDFWLDFPTDGIEKMDISFENPDDNVGFFERVFPDLRTLVLGFVYTRGNNHHNYKKVLSQTLPYVPAIKSLHLNIEFWEEPHVVFLDNVLNLPHLEELCMEFSWVLNKFGLGPRFYARLIETCPALRSLTLKTAEVKDVDIHALLYHPNLEKLDVTYLANGLRLVRHLPQMEKLSEFAVTVKTLSFVDVDGFCDAVRKMPNLKSLRVENLSDEEETLMLTREVIITATSMGKDVTVEKVYNSDLRRLKIESEKLLKVEADDEKIQILSLRIGKSSETYFDDVIKFVKQNLENHYAFELDYDLK